MKKRPISRLGAGAAADLAEFAVAFVAAGAPQALFGASSLARVPFA